MSGRERRNRQGHQESNEYSNYSTEKNSKNWLVKEFSPVAKEIRKEHQTHLEGKNKQSTTMPQSVMKRQFRRTINTRSKSTVTPIAKRLPICKCKVKESCVDKRMR
jgi:hypothetical protein